MQETKQLFFHVGLAKTGSTYLQHKVFPKFENIKYIQTGHYHNFAYVDIIKKSNERVFLTSREFDRQFETELKKIHTKFPDAKIIMVLRQHGGWLASQYRRSVKNGYGKTIEHYFNTQNTGEHWNISELNFYDKIQFAENLFKSKPLVLIYKDMKKSPYHFFDIIANFTGATYQKDKIDLSSKHKSYSEKQLKFIRKYNPYLFKPQFDYSKNRTIRQMQRMGRMLPRYLILYFAKLIPDRLYQKEPLIPKAYLDEIDAFFKDDWEKCLDYAKNNRVK